MSLTGKTKASSYKDILQMDNSNNGIDTTTRNIKDGEGTASALHLSDDQVAITPKDSDGTAILKVTDKEADDYYKSRSYGSKIGAWASKQSTILKSREELKKAIEDYKKKYPNEKSIPRPNYWSGWFVIPKKIEFWLQVDGRIHERLVYEKNENDVWNKYLLSP